jgi:hypothetical protein
MIRVVQCSFNYEHDTQFFAHNCGYTLANHCDYTRLFLIHDLRLCLVPARRAVSHPLR